MSFAPSSAAEPVANMLVVDNASWKSSLAVVAPADDVTLRTSDCHGFAAFTTQIQHGTGALYGDLASRLCNAAPVTVIQLPVLAGTPRLWTQATYRDSSGNRNYVAVPPLPEAISRSYWSPHSGVEIEYVFDGVQNRTGDDIATFVALIPDRAGQTTVQLMVTDFEDASHSTEETISIDGFNFHELVTPVKFGQLRVAHTGPRPADLRLYAVVFTGPRTGGSPRVELPRTIRRAYSE